MTGKLATILTKLISFSAHDGAEHSKVLERGLIIAVKAAPEKFTLRIARYGRIPPSTLEYQTCVRALPESYKPVSPVEPIGYLENGYSLLSASWQLPARLF